MAAEQRHPRLGSGTAYPVLKRKNTWESEWKRQQMSSYATVSPQFHTHTRTHTFDCVTADGVRRGDGGAATGTAFKGGSGGWEIIFKT